jgi:hypothetical protein
MAAKAALSACLPTLRSMFAVLPRQGHLGYRSHAAWLPPSLAAAVPPRASPPQQRAAVATAAGRPAALDSRIGFIGAGQMGEALIRGFIKAGMSTAGRISASVSTIERRELLSAMGINNVFDDAAEGGAAGVAGTSDVIFLGVRCRRLDAALPPCSSSALHGAPPRRDPPRSR